VPVLAVAICTGMVGCFLGCAYWLYSAARTLSVAYAGSGCFGVRLILQGRAVPKEHPCTLQRRVRIVRAAAGTLLG